jgi:hypothetical protein
MHSACSSDAHWMRKTIDGITMYRSRLVNEPAMLFYKPGVTAYHKMG